jgi:hypothetical protein
MDALLRDLEREAATGGPEERRRLWAYKVNRLGECWHEPFTKQLFYVVNKQRFRVELGCKKCDWRVMHEWEAGPEYRGRTIEINSEFNDEGHLTITIDPHPERRFSLDALQRQWQEQPSELYWRATEVDS